VPIHSSVRGTRHPIAYERGKTAAAGQEGGRQGLPPRRPASYDGKPPAARDRHLMLVKEALNHRDVTTTARYAPVHKLEVATALQTVAETHAQKTSPTTSPGDCPPIDRAKPCKTGT